MGTVHNEPQGGHNPVLAKLRTAILKEGGNAAGPPTPPAAERPEVARTEPEARPAPSAFALDLAVPRSRSTKLSAHQAPARAQEPTPAPRWERPTSLRRGATWAGPVVGDTYQVLTVLGDVLHDVTSARLSTVIGRQAAEAVAKRLAHAAGTGAGPIIVDATGLALKRLATGRVVYLEDIPAAEWFGAAPPPSGITRPSSGDLSRAVHAHLRAQVRRLGGRPAGEPRTSSHATALISCGLDAQAAATFIKDCIASSSTGVALPALRAPTSASSIRPPGGRSAT